MTNKHFGFMPNLIRGFKVFATLIVAGIILAVVWFLTRWILSSTEQFALGIVLGLVGFVLWLITVGYFILKFWGWK